MDDESTFMWSEYLNVYTHFKVDEKIILCNVLCVRKVKRGASVKSGVPSTNERNGETTTGDMIVWLQLWGV